MSSTVVWLPMLQSVSVPCNEFSVQDFCSVMRHIGQLHQFEPNFQVKCGLGVPCGTLCTAPLHHMLTGGIENC